MNTLPQSFIKGGFTHTLSQRDGMLAIYERTHHTASAPHFEVIKVQVARACMLNGRPYPEREAYPSPEEWGTAGWTYATLTDAQRKLEKLRTTKACEPMPFAAPLVRGGGVGSH